MPTPLSSKALLLFGLLFFIHLGQDTQALAQPAPQAPPPSLRTPTDTVWYSVNGGPPAAYRIAPRQRQARVEIACGKGQNLALFRSATDSTAIVLWDGRIAYLYLVQGHDSTLLEVAGVPKNVRFSAAYVQRKTGKTDIELPEVHELANILAALSQVGQLDSNMVDMTTPYHKEVLAYFAPYLDHPILDTVNSHIRKPLDTESYWYYYALKMNAAGYAFNRKGEIRNTGVIRKMGFQNEQDPIGAHAVLLADFARQSGFRKFYRDHRPYYRRLIATYRELNPVQDMQRWLQARFPMRYGHTRVIFSPLVGGAHAARRFRDNGLEQTVLYVSRAERDPGQSDNVNRLLNSRVVFTELDHSFVNPTSDRYTDQIAEAFSNRGQWVKETAGTNAYATPYMVFNEYMTFALFSLYALDRYPPEDVAAFLPMMEGQMYTRRGFYRFTAFNRKLISLYREHPNLGIEAMYREMLRWCRAVNDAAA